MKKQKENRDQYIVSYDIENSKIYEVYYYYEYRNIYVKCPVYQSYLTEYMGVNTSYITNENADRARRIINWSNKKHDMHYELIAFTHKYIANLYCYDIKRQLINSKFTYEPFTDNIAFKELIMLWIEKDSDIFFTAHNLDYEFNYIRYNTRLLHMLKDKCESYEIIAETTSNIKRIMFISPSGSKFIICDTYLISNKSIKNLGNLYGLPKLEYDYEQTRLFRYDITETDREYNKRDNEIAMRYLQDLQEILPIYNNICKLPLSATQHSKNICRYNKNVNYKPEGFKCDLFYLHKSLSKKYNIQTFELYRNFYNASGGGLIGVNPKYTGRWLENVQSFDIKSAHPGQFYNKKFPKGESIREVNNYDWILKRYEKLSETMQRDPREFYNNFLPAYDYLLLVEFEDLQAKTLPNNNYILSLGSGKNTQNPSDNAVTNRLAYNYKGKSINGKTEYSKVYRKWLFGIDFIYHLSFYKANVKILKAYKYSLEPCDQYIISKADYYGEYKEKYKSFTKYARKHDFDETKKYIIENGAEEYTINNLVPENYQEFLDVELLRIKGIFNGLFGQEYQNIFHEELEFDSVFDVKEKEKDENGNPITLETIKNKYEEIAQKSTTHYPVGAYTAAWSRFELACMIWQGINAGGTIYYFHTDSIKIGEVTPELFKDWYDPELQYNYWNDHNIYNFGLVDFEETYRYFYTPETLKNVGILPDERDETKIRIDITISGIKANVYFKDVYDKFQGAPYTPENVEELKKDLTKKLTPQLIPPELTGKLVRNRRFAGVKSELGQVNFGALEPIEYNFLHFKEE